MASIELTHSQQTVLRALVNLYEQQDEVVKGASIASAVARNPGTVRNQMQSLKALQLVTGVPGSKGGYKPTATAYEVLDIQQLDRAATVPLYRNGELVEESNVVEIDLTSVHHPDLCRAGIRVRGSVRAIDEGDVVTVGPTPLSKLVVDGVVDGTDESAGTVVLRIERMRVRGAEGDH